MKRIPLNGRHGKGRFAIVDDAIFEKLRGFKWTVDKKGYVRAQFPNRTKFTIQQFVIQNKKASQGYVIDHINGNTLDNRRSNLRLCTRMENARNCKKRSNNKTGYTGVVVATLGKKNPFMARISVNGKLYHLGRFPTAIEASRAYQIAAKKHFGKFVRRSLDVL